MGTYTSYYNLYMPSVGETGWGELVNTNFTHIDATLNDVNTNISNINDRTANIESGNVGTITVGGNAIIGGNINADKINVDTNQTYGITYGSGSFGHTCGRFSAAPIMVLPFSPNITYSGSIYATRNYASNYSGTLYCLVGSDDTQYTIQTVSATMSSSATLNLPANCHGAWFGSSMGYTIRYPIFTST